MKILDRYILTTYLKTFISVFLILMLIFVLQAIWLYISELAGKDLDIGTVGKFLVYITPTLIPLILPLTILLSSIMVFGNFSENYEFAAMKSTGISLQRAMKSLSVFIVILGVTVFFFSNNVIPWAQYNSYNLRKNIAKLKPAMVIAEGQFNQVGNINIKVSEKSGDRGQYLKDVVIHKKSSNVGNFTTILSKSGELISSETSNILKLVLHDGNYYDELQPTDYKERLKKPFAKSAFKTYTLNIDLAQMNSSVNLEDKQVTSKYDMLSIADLDYTIDSLKIKGKDRLNEFSDNLYKRSQVSIPNKEVREDDADEEVNPLEVAKVVQDIEVAKVVQDMEVAIELQDIEVDEALQDIEVDEALQDIEVSEMDEDSIAPVDYMNLFPTKKKIQLVEMALNNIVSTNQIIAAKDKELLRETRWLNKHVMAFHDKFALGFACIILFFVGAPLGALIKKGGLGLPMVIAIALFLIYHFIGIFAKNSAEDSSLNPMLASWLSTLVMLPIGVYLTERATKDKGLFDIDLILQPIKKLFKIKVSDNDDNTVALSAKDYEVLKSYDNEKLIDVVKNYRQYDYTVSYKKSSLDILQDRGVTKEELRMSGNLSNPIYEEASNYFSDYQQGSKMALKFYLLALITLVLYFVFNNNKLPAMAKASTIISGISGFLYLIFLGRSLMHQTKFYKTLQKKDTNNMLIFTILGLPLYFMIYFFFRKKMKEELKLVR